MILRKNRSNNCLLVKDEIGTTKLQMRAVPKFGFSYGLQTQPDSEGAMHRKLFHFLIWTMF